MTDNIKAPITIKLGNIFDGYLKPISAYDLIALANIALDPPKCETCELWKDTTPNHNYRGKPYGRCERMHIYQGGWVAPKDFGCTFHSEWSKLRRDNA